MTLTYSILPGYTTKAPERGSLKAAGLDIWVPLRTEEFDKDFNKLNRPDGDTTAGAPFLNNDSIVVAPHGRVLIPTGLKFNIFDDTYLEGKNRSGVAAKFGLILGPCVIDSDYQGQVFIGLINTNAYPVYIKYDTKIAQLIHKEYIHSEVQQVAIEELYSETSQRGDGALGSTDKPKPPRPS